MICIEDIPFTVDLSDILTELKNQLNANGIELLNAGKDGYTDIMVSCPYHKKGKERRPSAGIRKTDGIFHCFACGETHTLPEVISYCFGHQDLGSFGFRWLIKNFTAVRVEDRKDVELDMDRNIRASSSRISFIRANNFHGAVRGNSGSRRENKAVSEEELNKYRYYHPYMWKRGLTPEIVDIFDIGYDKEKECLTFPIRDISGETLFIARRSVKSKYFNYPASAEKPLYGLYELMRLDDFPKEVIVCESMLDALTCWVYGKYAVALNGLGTELQFLQLRSLPCRKLILATDNDSAGMAARQRIRKKLGSYKLISEYLLPDGRKDINELTKNEFYNLLEIF